MSRGTENRLKSVAVLMPASDNIPNKVGPKIAPKRPTPTENPTPVVLISVS